MALRAKGKLNLAIEDFERAGQIDPQIQTEHRVTTVRGGTLGMPGTLTTTSW